MALLIGGRGEETTDSDLLTCALSGQDLDRGGRGPGRGRAHLDRRGRGRADLDRRGRGQGDLERELLSSSEHLHGVD